MKKIAIILSVLCLIASIVMYKVGNSSSHLSELADFWWVPLPLAILALLMGMRNTKQSR
jgi:hypothetical protein